jgi:hypothetical protein
MAENTDTRQILLNMGMELLVSQNAGHFLTSGLTFEDGTDRLSRNVGN